MNQIVNASSFGTLSPVFANAKRENGELSAGVVTGYGVIGYKGKVWSTRYQGVETPLMRSDGDGPRGSIEVVIIKAPPYISKRYYANGFTDDAKLAPDCQSANGITPDASVINKQSPTCANCPMNAWGSRVTEAGKQGKACSDSKRVAVVPLEDFGNELLGGPMLLNIPAASLRDLKSYDDKLGAMGFVFYGVGTRISFDPSQAYPKFVFNPIRPLEDHEAREILRLREDPRVARIISEASDGHQELPPPVSAENFFEQPPAPKAPAPAAAAAPPKAAAPKAAPKAAAPKPAPEPTPEVTEVAAAPADFDDMLDGLLK